jgi:hypothetical protein
MAGPRAGPSSGRAWLRSWPAKARQNSEMRHDFHEGDSNEQNGSGNATNSFSYTSISRSTKKRTFDFDLSQNDPPTTATSPRIQNAIPSRRIERNQSTYSVSDAKRRNILDCIEDVPRSSNYIEEPLTHAEMRALPSAIPAIYKLHDDQPQSSDCFADEGFILDNGNECSRTTSKSRCALLNEFRECDEEFGVPHSQFRAHGSIADGRQTSLKASRPQLPGPASLGCDLPSEGMDKNSQSTERLELPLRTRHLCVSPNDPDFNAFSWEKMLRDLDLDPFTGSLFKSF